MTSRQLRCWLAKIDTLKDQYLAKYGDRLTYKKVLRFHIARWFVQRLIRDGMPPSEARQRAWSHVNSPAYQHHFNYVYKRLSEARTKARQGQL